MLVDLVVRRFVALLVTSATFSPSIVGENTVYTDYVVITETVWKACAKFSCIPGTYRAYRGHARREGQQDRVLALLLPASESSTMRPSCPLPSCGCMLVRTSKSAVT